MRCLGPLCLVDVSFPSSSVAPKYRSTASESSLLIIVSRDHSKCNRIIVVSENQKEKTSVHLVINDSGIFIAKNIKNLGKIIRRNKSPLKQKAKFPFEKLHSKCYL